MLSLRAAVRYPTGGSSTASRIGTITLVISGLPGRMETYTVDTYGRPVRTAPVK